MNSLHLWINEVWYGKSQHWRLALWPFSILYRAAIKLRHLYFHWRPAPPLPLPVIVVGNVTAGGSGKTPAVLGIAELLSQQGFSVAVIARAYGARKTVRTPQAVNADSSPYLFGDEAVLIAQRGLCPVVVAANRYQAACYVIKHYAVDVIIADDGLQHYGLPRQIEIAVIDGQRRFGNGLLLPAGPLREPLSRLKEVDCRLVKGAARPGEHAMHLHPQDFVRLSDGASRPLDSFRGQQVSAYAGIASPDSFFSALTQLGMVVDPHPLPDHYAYSRDDCQAMAAMNHAVIMTEKDAVKCMALLKPAEHLLFLRVQAVFDQQFKQRLLSLMNA